MERNPNPSSSERLDSWKAIANYLGKTVRTVQRWEQSAGLPVRRIDAEAGASVYAFTHELDRWLTRRNLQVHDAPAEPAPSPEPASATPTPVGEAGAEVDPANGRRARATGWWAPIALLALVGGAYLLWQLRPGASVPAVSLAQLAPPRFLTTEPGDERFPALSPDGRQVAYVWTDPQGRVDIHLRTVAISESQRLTNDDAIEESVKWSPDGLSLAYLKRSGPERRQLRVMSAVGSDDRLLHGFAVSSAVETARSTSASLDWSPDGRWIAFSEGESGRPAMRLSLLRVSDRQVLPLTGFVDGMADTAPAFSPDGRHLAFTRSPGGQIATIHLVDLALEPRGASSDRVLPGNGDWNSDAAWTPDGRELVFSSGLWPRTRLWRVAAGGASAPEPLAHADAGASQPSIAPWREPGAAHAAWRLVYRQMSLENDIWRIDLAGDAPDEPIIASSQRERFPSQGASGRIAFLSDRNGHREIYELPEGERGWQQWTDWKSNFILSQAFSPDGTTLAYIVEVDGRFMARLQRQPLSPSESLYREGFQDLALAWARDGRALYLRSRQVDDSRATGSTGVWRVDTSSGERRLLLAGDYTPIGDGPGGTRLFVIEGDIEGHGNRLWTLDLESEALAEVPLGDRAHHSFAPGPDGVYMVATRDGETWVEVWPWEGPSLRPVKRLDHDPETGMAVAPDGGHALLARIVQRRSDLMLMESRSTQ